MDAYSFICQFHNMTHPQISACEAENHDPEAEVKGSWLHTGRDGPNAHDQKGEGIC